MYFNQDDELNEDIQNKLDAGDPIKDEEALAFFVQEFANATSNSYSCRELFKRLEFLTNQYKITLSRIE